MSAVTLRPSSLPLPVKMAVTAAARKPMVPQRSKLTSTSSSQGSTTPTTPGSAYERQVKSLTPERGFLHTSSMRVKRTASSKAIVVQNKNSADKSKLLRRAVMPKVAF